MSAKGKAKFLLNWSGIQLTTVILILVSETQKNRM